MALRNQPYLPLYIQDFMTDEKLIECSAESTGVYIRILCMMHKSKEYGKILLKQKDKQNGKQIINFAYKVAKFMPYPFAIIEKSLTELIDEDVLQLVGDDLCQKRMIRDNEISLIRSDAGKKGGKKSKLARAKDQAKHEANSEYEFEGIYKGKIRNKIPPDLKDVQIYIIEKGFKVDANNFIDFYQSKGWMVGKNKMKDWQAAVRTWQDKNIETEQSKLSDTVDWN